MGWLETGVIVFFGFMIASQAYKNHKEAIDGLLFKFKEWIMGR